MYNTNIVGFSYKPALHDSLYWILEGNCHIRTEPLAKCQSQTILSCSNAANLRIWTPRSIKTLHRCVYGSLQCNLNIWKKKNFCLNCLKDDSELTINSSQVHVYGYTLSQNVKSNTSKRHNESFVWIKWGMRFLFYFLSFVNIL